MSDKTKKTHWLAIPATGSAEFLECLDAGSISRTLQHELKDSAFPQLWCGSQLHSDLITDWPENSICIGIVNYIENKLISLFEAE